MATCVRRCNRAHRASLLFLLLVQLLAGSCLGQGARVQARPLASTASDRRKLRQAACVPWNVTVTDGANANAFITSMPALSEDGGRAIVVGSWYGQETFRVFVPLTDGGSYVLSVLWLPNSEYKCTGTPRVCIIVREVMLGLPGAGLEVVPAPLMDGPGFARVALTVGESKALNVQVDVLSEPTMTPTGIRLDVKAAPCL